MADANPVFDPMGALQQLTEMPRMMMEQQKQAAARNIEQLGRTRSAADYAASPETEGVQQLGAMALAAGKSPTTVGGFGQLLANIGGVYATTKAAQAQQRFEREKEMTGLVEKASPFSGSGVATQLAHAVLNPIQNIGGVGVSRLTGQSMVPKEFTSKYLDLREKFYAKLVESGEPDAYNKADEMAKQAIYAGLRDPSVAGSTFAQRPEATPMPAQVDGSTTTTPAASQPPAVELVPGTDQAALQRQLKRDEDLAVKSGDYARAQELRTARQAIEKQAPTKAPAQPLSKAEMARGEETAKGEAKGVHEYEQGIVTASSESSKMLTNLDKLVEQSKKANFGPTAGFKTQALKWAQDLGVKLTDQDRAAADANQVIEKIALQLATLGAKAISSRPTQMEFEKLLTQGVPNTVMTSGAFNQVLDMFRKQATNEQSKLGEFMQWKHALPANQRSTGDFENFWALRSDPRYATVKVQDILDTMRERNMTWNQVIEKLRGRK